MRTVRNFAILQSSVRYVKVGIGVLAGAIVLQGIFVAILALLLMQSTSKSVLLQRTFLGRITVLPGLVRTLDKSLNIFYRGPSPPEPLPHYALTLDRADLAQIEASLPPEDVYFVDASRVWAKGMLTFEGRQYETKARVRGDRYNHWRFAKKSWRLSFPKGAPLHGMRELNLIIPEDRAWFVELLSANRAERFGLLHPPMHFVTVSLNGSAPMLYLEVEHWTKEMLEKLALPGDVNLYKTGSVGTSAFNPGWDPIEEDPAYWGKFEKALATPYDSYEEVELFLALAREGAHRDPGFREKIETLFDTEELVRWYALSLLAGNLHVGGDNLRFFFDVTKGHFRPFVWDVFSTAPRSLQEAPGNPLWQEIFSLPDMQQHVRRFLSEYVGDEERVRADLAEAAHLRELIERAAYRDPLKFQSNRLVQQDLDRRTNEVRANIEAIRSEIRHSELPGTALHSPQ